MSESYHYIYLLLKYFQTGMRCCDCGYSCHEKCSENVPKSCTKYKAVADRTLTNQNANRTCGETTSVNSSEL